MIYLCRAPENGLEPPWKKLFAPPARADGLKIVTIYWKTVSCRVTCAWSERVHLYSYSRQIMMLPRKTKTYAKQSGPGPPSGIPSSGNCCPPLVILCTHTGCEGVRYSANPFYNLSVRKGWVASSKSQPLYPRKRSGNHCTGGWVDLGVALDSTGNLAPSRTERFTYWSINAARQKHT